MSIPYLSYSGRSCYLTCPKKYEFSYILKTECYKDPKGTIFGSSIGTVFEWFYNKKFWAEKDPVGVTLNSINDAVKKVCTKENFDLSMEPEFRSDLYADLKKFVPSGIDIIKEYRFLTVDSRAEVDLSVIFDNGTDKFKIGGRADFVHRESDKNIWIIDGKGSKHHDKYVDSEQLIWYATQYYLKFGVAPTRLGFLFWKFPKDNPVKWVQYSEEDMLKSIEVTTDTVRKIQLKVFDPVPSGSCYKCEFLSNCYEGTKHINAKRAEKSKKIFEDVIFDVEFTK